MSALLYFIVRTDSCLLHNHMKVWSRERAADVTPPGLVEEGATHMCKAVRLTSLHWLHGYFTSAGWLFENGQHWCGI